VLVAWLSSGCSYGRYPRVTLAGRAIPWAKVEAVPVGSTHDEVAMILGPASEIRSEKGDTVWSYYELARLGGCKKTTLFITTGKLPVVEYTGHVTFRNGHVVEVSKAERNTPHRPPASTGHP
jgi:hypothetical protein